MAIVLIGAVACESATAPTTFAGRYTLQSVNSASLPAVIAPSAELVSGALTLKDDGTYTERLTVRLRGETRDDATTGTWASEYASITLTENGEGEGKALLVATFDSNTLHLTNGIYTYLFRR
jgi:hypothetical protein